MAIKSSSPGNNRGGRNADLVSRAKLGAGLGLRSIEDVVEIIPCDSLCDVTVSAQGRHIP